METTKQVNWLFFSIFSKLNISFTQKGVVESVQSFGSYDLASISDCLRSYNIKNIGVKLSIDELSKIPLPAIVVLKGTSLSFGIIRQIEGKKIEYEKYKIGRTIVSIEDFLQEWTGHALLLEKTEKSGEPNYAVNRRLEILEKVRGNTAYCIIGLLLAACFLAWPNLFFPILFLGTGLGLSVALLKQTFGQETILGQAVCKAGTSTDCRKVINSKLAKVYADISLAEIALLFFVCAFGIQVSSLVTGQGYNFLLGWLSLAAFPVTVMSIYYQWRVLKNEVHTLTLVL